MTIAGDLAPIIGTGCFIVVCCVIFILILDLIIND